MMSTIARDVMLRHDNAAPDILLLVIFFIPSNQKGKRFGKAVAEIIPKTDYGKSFQNWRNKGPRAKLFWTQFYANVFSDRVFSTSQ